jgi:hypothetical protein
MFGTMVKRLIVSRSMETMTPEQAEEQADAWLEYELEEEKLNHADDMEFQFNSPDLFHM